jgi:hypothetical protein
MSVCSCVNVVLMLVLRLFALHIGQTGTFGWKLLAWFASLHLGEQIFGRVHSHFFTFIGGVWDQFGIFLISCALACLNFSKWFIGNPIDVGDAPNDWPPPLSNWEAKCGIVCWDMNARPVQNLILEKATKNL